VKKRGRLRFMQGRVEFTKGLAVSAAAPESGPRNLVRGPRQRRSKTTTWSAHPPVSRRLHMVRRVAATRATVLYSRESGVGKEIFARTLHRISPRCKETFVAINCAAIPEALVSPELFGSERRVHGRDAKP